MIDWDDERVAREITRCREVMAACLVLTLPGHHCTDSMLGYVDNAMELEILEDEMRRRKKMKIVEPYARMIGSRGPETSFNTNDGIELLRNIEYYARVSHASEDKMTADSWDRFLRSVVMGHGDFSVIEHEKVTCEFLVDRGITHEIVRHRVGSYTQESTRFVNYKKSGGEAKFVSPIFDSTVDYFHWENAMRDCERAYMTLCSMEPTPVKPQIARSVLPNALASKIIVTYNLRSWRHFFLMRTSAQAHPQMRQVCDPLLARFKETIPILYEDIKVGAQQSDNMRMMR